MILIEITVSTLVVGDNARRQPLTAGTNSHSISLAVKHITSGKRVRSPLDNPFRLGPLATTEFLIERDDAVGGSGASFIVEWVASQPVNEPIVEAVMISTDRHQWFSFARRGTAIGELPIHVE